MTISGYYQHPTIYKDTVIFVCEDDLWLVAASGGVARRLTANLGPVSRPIISPDGDSVAFVGREDGEREIYVMPTLGGPAERLTYLGSASSTAGWTSDGQSIIFFSDYGQFDSRQTFLYTVGRDGGYPARLPYGPAKSIAFGNEQQVVIGRRVSDLAGWKRYRGGRAGDIWVDTKGKGTFKSLLPKLAGNMAGPMWLNERIYFVSDHEGVGNLYSCTPQGNDVQRHTHHEAFYVRHPQTDGTRIVYQAGADLYCFNPSKKGKAASTQIEIEFHSPRVQRNRKFITASHYLDHYTIHPDGHSFGLTARGKPFTMSNWEGAAIQYGDPQGVRYRLMEWLNDGKRLVMVSDADGDEQLEVYTVDDNKRLATLNKIDLGRPLFLEVSPNSNGIVLANHRYELLHIDDRGTLTPLDKSDYGRITQADWSADGAWVVYNFPTSLHTSAIKLCHVESGETHFITRPHDLCDYEPSFDPEGNYIYFLSRRDFDPVSDNHYFDWSFPQGTRPYLVTLRADLPNPFIPLPNGSENGNGHGNGSNGNGTETAAAKSETTEETGHETNAKQEKADEAEPTLKIDLEGIENRVVAFPVAEGRYGRIAGLPKNKVIYTLYPVQSSLNGSRSKNGRGTMKVYDLSERKEEVLVGGVSSFKVARRKGFIMYRNGRELRILKAAEKPDAGSSGFNKKSGWLKPNRAKVAVNPPDEWRQMLQEAWRLQRDHFWTADMSNIDWAAIYERYLALIDRVASRAEFSDLIGEMQGELGTSHAYEMGGDYRYGPSYRQGFLGADFEYDSASDGYRLSHIVQGDSWLEKIDSPLNRLGVNVERGDVLVAINGQPLSSQVSPQQLLINQANMEVLLEFATPHHTQTEAETETETEREPEDESDSSPSNAPRRVLVKTLGSETQARYREWVEKNRRQVHAATDGQVGYLHIPDMGVSGFAEFHRYYLAESERLGLIIDVRFNRGGNVSQLLLRKLTNRRIGYKQPRHGEPWPYPRYSMLGPMITIANEYTASDGDIFTHAFKLLKLGKVIGKRTWGGVIGIWPRHSLVDGTTTSQPEFSNWFEDVGWGIENYGTDPTIEVDIKPQDYAKGKDTQLERAIKEILKQIKRTPPKLPEFGPKPNLAPPKLPKPKGKT